MLVAVAGSTRIFDHFSREKNILILNLKRQAVY